MTAKPLVGQDIAMLYHVTAIGNPNLFMSHLGEVAIFSPLNLRVFTIEH